MADTQAPSQERLRILVVDDSPTQRMALRLLMEGSGFTVLTAADGREGLAVAESTPLDLVISDVVMPEMDGYALCKALRGIEALRSLPVILLTSLTDPQDVIHGLESGASNFICKPFDGPQLVARVQNILANQEIRRSSASEMGISIFFAGKRFFITADRLQILDLLLSTYENAVSRSSELVRARDELRALNEQLETRVAERTATLTAEVRERARAEQALRKSEERLRDIIFSVGDWVWEVNAQGAYTYSSGRSYEMLGHPPEETIGKRPFDFMRPEEAERVGAIFAEIAARKGPIRDLENWNVRKNGESACLLTNGVPILDEAGELRGYRGVDKDITASKRAAEEHERLAEQLRATQKMEAIGILAGGIAHDFNNLISVILSYTGIALTAVGETEPLRADLLEVKKSAERAAALTRQLLAFSRKQVLQPVPLSLNQVAEGIEKMLRRILGEDIDFRLALAPDLGVARADPGQMDQVLMNLVVNARDAMPRGGKLTLETSNVELDEEYAAQHLGVRPGPYVRLAVSDTGSGMDPKILERVFEPFFTTKEKGKGTGLGLPMVYGIVKQSEGHISVYSEPGKGTSFKIYLPRDLSAKAAATTRTAAAPMLTQGTETILVVEDEEALIRVAMRSLGQAGYTVLTAGDGEEALRTAAAHPGTIHLLATDVVMPRMGGRALATELSKTRPGLKILYMSGYTDDAIIHHGVLEHGTNFLAKPFTAVDLARKVREALDRA
jgi:two-component system cell cycle sensor histidine kinase/response regulator CckA